MDTMGFKVSQCLTFFSIFSCFSTAGSENKSSGSLLSGAEDADVADDVTEEANISSDGSFIFVFVFEFEDFPSLTSPRGGFSTFLVAVVEKISSTLLPSTASVDCLDVFVFLDVSRVFVVLVLNISSSSSLPSASISTAFVASFETGGFIVSTALENKSLGLCFEVVLNISSSLLSLFKVVEAFGLAKTSFVWGGLLVVVFTKGFVVDGAIAKISSSVGGLIVASDDFEDEKNKSSSLSSSSKISAAITRFGGFGSALMEAPKGAILSFVVEVCGEMTGRSGSKALLLV